MRLLGAVPGAVNSESAVPGAVKVQSKVHWCSEGVTGLAGCTTELPLGAAMIYNHQLACHPL